MLRNNKIRFLMAASLLLFGGCTVGSTIISEQDPDIAPSKTDSIYLAAPDEPTIEDRQFVALLRTELPANGFLLLPSPENAKWVIVGSMNDRTWLSGMRTNLVVPFVGVSKNTYSTHIVNSLALFPADSFAAGKRSPVWIASSDANTDLYGNYPRSVVKLLADRFATNFRGVARVSRSYEKSGSSQ